ncbi:sugar transporter [Yoonia sp. R2331]|uniref:sugar transporter n=1 Tax=Yoonia sp. R2331 TaxID=3237238 RepID=UPI0034E606AA
MHVNTLAERVHELCAQNPRVLVGIAGAPASGKSTLAEEVARRLTLQKVRTVVVPMDGFHLDNAILEARDLRPRKGAPETFDAIGFIHLINRLKENVEVFVPAFDRVRDLSIAGAIAVPANTQVVIVEGNYLMFDEAPWEFLAPLWDLTARLDIPMEQLRARLIHRWLSLNYSRAVATRRAEGNDIPNAERVLKHALPCDITLT